MSDKPRQPIVIPGRSGVDPHKRQIATDLIRQQIDSIYSSDPNFQTTEPVQPSDPQPQPTQTSYRSPVQPKTIELAAETYQKTRPDRPQSVNLPDNWKTYHSAWQNYYQQYYERYYANQVYLSEHQQERARKNQTKVPLASTNDAKGDELYDIRSRIRQTIRTRSQKIRSSRHFIPGLAAAIVLLVFVFLQYNRVLFATVNAYVSPGNIDPAVLIIDPNAAGAVSETPKLIIPKINVDVPIIWDAVASSQSSLNAAMDKGVAWFNIPGANARPGELGNFVLSGHSSNDWLVAGDYKFIFARLEQLKEGDTVYVDYHGTRYIYSITRTQVVAPTDVDSLRYDTDKPEITLLTCTPLGTALNRLLVIGEQISPDPGTATEVTASSDTTEAVEMPANAPTFLERLFGGGN